MARRLPKRRAGSVGQDRGGRATSRSKDGDSPCSAVTTSLTIGHDMNQEEKDRLLERIWRSTSIPKGVSLNDLAAIGVPMPLRKGWRDRIFGITKKQHKKMRPWLRSIPTSPQTAPVKQQSAPVSAWKRKASLFYRSREWADARYDALKRSKGSCELCGRGKADGAVLNVDHIKPLKQAWELRLDLSNLQVLCGMCNKGKGNRDDTDWREKEIELTVRWRDLVRE